MASRISDTLEGLGVGLGNAGRIMLQDKMQDQYYTRQQQRGQSREDEELKRLLRSLGLTLPDDPLPDPETSS